MLNALVVFDRVWHHPVKNLWKVLDFRLKYFIYEKWMTEATKG